MTTGIVQNSLNDAPMGAFIVNSKWQLIYVNKKALPVFENITDLFGMDFDEVLKIMWAPDTAAELSKRFRRTLETGEPYRVPEFYDTRLDRSKRRYYNLQIQPMNLDDGEKCVVCYFTDLTTYVHEREQLDEARRQFNDLAEALPQMVWTADVDGGLIYTNQFMYEYTGAKVDSLRGSGFNEFVHKDDVENVKKLWRDSLASGDKYEVDCRVRGTSGQYRWYLVRGVPVRDDQGNIVKWFGTCTDIHSERLASEELEKRVQERTEQLVQALAEAEKAGSLKVQFVSNISHEVRTPMSAILGLSEYLTTLELDAEVQDVAAHILSASTRLMSILNDLLDFSKLEAGKVAVEHIAFAPGETLAEVVKLFQHQCQEKGVTIKLNVADAIPQKVCGDEQKTRQILTNLVSNACKFTSAGEVTVAAEIESETSAAMRLRISVSDTGIGIADSARSLIFEPFTQADGTMTRRFGGTGLGLAISKRYVQLLGGEIGFVSFPGKGSKFWFTVPFLNEDAEPCRLNLQDAKN